MVDSCTPRRRFARVVLFIVHAVIGSDVTCIARCRVMSAHRPTASYTVLSDELVVVTWSVWSAVCRAGERRMIEALEGASYDDKPWTGYSTNIADLLLKLLAKRPI